jgi:hypothetical protein
MKCRQMLCSVMTRKRTTHRALVLPGIKMKQQRHTNKPTHFGLLGLAAERDEQTILHE